MGGLAPCPMRNPQPGGPGFFCQGVLPLATISSYLKAPDPRLMPLSLSCSRTALPGLWQGHATADCGRAYNTVGVSLHLWGTPGGLSTPHRDPLPPFNPTQSVRLAGPHKAGMGINYFWDVRVITRLKSSSLLLSWHLCVRFSCSQSRFWLFDEGRRMGNRCVFAILYQIS